jgi:hypothetical protein
MATPSCVEVPRPSFTFKQKNKKDEYEKDEIVELE